MQQEEKMNVFFSEFITLIIGVLVVALAIGLGYRWAKSDIFQHLKYSKEPFCFNGECVTVRRKK